MGSNRHGQLGYAIDSQPTPRRVSSLRQRVVAVAAANKHSVAVTAGGDVYTWGSNVLGQVRACVCRGWALEHASELLNTRNAAWPKQSLPCTTWPCCFAQLTYRLHGPRPALQLGYGTSDSNSNAAPRMVEAMKGKRVVAAAAAKRHTLVLTAGGEVYTWGHRGVSPRRVQLAVSAVDDVLWGCGMASD